MLKILKINTWSLEELEEEINKYPDYDVKWETLTYRDNGSYTIFLTKGVVGD